MTIAYSSCDYDYILNFFIRLRLYNRLRNQRGTEMFNLLDYLIDNTLDNRLTDLNLNRLNFFRKGNLILNINRVMNFED